MTQPDPEPVYRMVLAELQRIRPSLLPPRSLFMEQMGWNLSMVDALIPLLEQALGEGPASVEADPVLARITYDPGEQQLAPIPWPEGLAPRGVDAPDRPHGMFPGVNAVIITFTAAEARALADVMTPGVQSSHWTPYDYDFASYEPMLTNRSPARQSRRLGSWHLSEVGLNHVLCFKSELHPATDSPELPLAKLVQQIVEQVKPKLFITTGTAGGVEKGTQVGDVVIADWVHWDCTERFKAEEWAHEAFQTSWSKMPALRDVSALLAPNFARLPADLVGRAPKVWDDLCDLVSTDGFAVGDTTDSFGLLKAVPSACCVDEDDGAVGLAMRQIGYSVPFLSIRSISDPVMPGDEPLEKQRRDASAIYERWGYASQVAGAICCWAAIVGMGDD